MTVTLDAEFGIRSISPVCVWCRHLHLEEIRACDAYIAEESIPLPIWNGGNKHRRPYPGDHGIRFEKATT